MKIMQWVKDKLEAGQDKKLLEQKSSKVSQLEQQVQNLSKQLEFYKEFYEIATSIEPAFDVNITEEMSAIPLNYKSSISEVLSKMSFDITQQCIKNTDHINHIIYRNGVLTAINKFKEYLAIPTKQD